jgi:hypothetical protein
MTASRRPSRCRCSRSGRGRFLFPGWAAETPERCERRAGAASRAPDERQHRNHRSTARLWPAPRHFHDGHSRGSPTGSADVLQPPETGRARSRSRRRRDKFAGASALRRPSHAKAPCARTRTKRSAKTPRAITVRTKNVSTATHARLRCREMQTARPARSTACKGAAARSRADSKTAISTPS